MKLTRERLKQIIREELICLNEIEQPKSNPEIARFAKKVSEIIKIDPQKAKSMSSEWKSAQEALSSNPALKSSDVESMMPSWKGIEPAAIKFHLRKKFMTPEEIEKELNNSSESEKTKPEISSNKVKEISPSERMKNTGPSHGHTQFGTEKAPREMPEEQAADYLRNKFKGAPLWKFEILRDPTDKKLYAYYEMDTSG